MELSCRRSLHRVDQTYVIMHKCLVHGDSPCPVHDSDDDDDLEETPHPALRPYTGGQLVGAEDEP